MILFMYIKLTNSIIYVYLYIIFELQGENVLRKNKVKQFREALLMSKSELARMAGVSDLTVDRVEKGSNCRLQTKRKIIFSLGFKLSEKDKIFPQD